MELLNLMRNRRSIRTYTGQPISQDKLDQILRAGLLAPSSKNIRPVEFIVVETKDTLRALARSKAAGAVHLANAACAIVVLGDSGQADAWIEDCSIAMTYMMLMAEQMDIGACWIQERLRQTASGQSAGDFVRELLAIPKQYEVEAILALGISAEQPSPRNWDKQETDKIHREQF
jgi:nitroreductase